MADRKPKPNLPVAGPPLLVALRQDDDERRRLRIDELRLKGYSADRIAKRLRLPRAKVLEDIRYLENLEKQTAEATAREQKRAELDKQYLDQINEATKQMKQAIKQKNFQAAVQFQKNILEAMAKRMALWGVEQAAERASVTVRSGSFQIEFVKPEELKEIERGSENGPTH